jgi:hypothetical protein
MKKLTSSILILSLLAGCSTAGGIYKNGDHEHGEFSAGNTILGIVGVVGVVLGVKALSDSEEERGGGGGYSYFDTGYAWDYQPGNNQWVCRDKSNGQYAYKSNCKGLSLIDNWP